MAAGAALDLLGPPGRPTVYTQVGPEMVVEVAVDTAVEHHRWRHPARFVRLRPDLHPIDLAPRTRSDATADQKSDRRSSG